MAVKYVKDFEFPSTSGFTGSAGKSSVKGYMRGGSVKAEAGPRVAKSAKGLQPAQGKAMSLHDSMMIQGKKLGFAAGGLATKNSNAPNDDDCGPVPSNKGRTQQEVEAGGSKNLKPGFKKGGKAKPMKKARGGVVKKAEGGSIPDNWSSMSDAQKRAWADAQTAPSNKSKQTPSARVPTSTSPSVPSLGTGAAARAAGALKQNEMRQRSTIDDAMSEMKKSMGVGSGSDSKSDPGYKKGGKVNNSARRLNAGATRFKDFNKDDMDPTNRRMQQAVGGAEQYGSARAKGMAKGGDFMATAVSRPGAFKAKAKKAGMSTSAFASKVTAPGSEASTRTKRQANLAKTFAKYRP